MSGMRNISPGRRARALCVLALMSLLIVPVRIAVAQTTGHDEAINISAMPDPVASGGQLTVTMNVTNLGPTAAAGANLTTATPTGTTFVSATTSKGVVSRKPAFGGTGSIECQFGPLNVSQVVTLTIVLTVTAAPGASITMDGEVQPLNPMGDPNQNNNIDSITVAVAPPATADLGVAVTAERDEAGSESLFSYQISIQNLSASPAGAERRDLVNNVVAILNIPSTAVFSSVNLSQGTASPPAIGESGRVICSLGTLDNGASATVDLNVAVVAEPGATLTFTASVSGDAVDPAPDNNSSSSSVPVIDSNVAMLMWEAPEAVSAGNPLPSPRRFVVTQVAGRVPGEVGLIADPEPARRGELLGYNVYRSNQPGVAPTPGNLFTSTPPNQTNTTAPVAPGGSFFTVTAMYDDGESAPSNEGSADVPAATLTSVKVKPAKITAKGMNFSTGVAVFVDGIPFVSPAALKAGGTKVVQKGTLLTGQTIQQYLQMHPRVVVSFRNSNGGIATYLHPQ